MQFFMSPCKNTHINVYIFIYVHISRIYARFCYATQRGNFIFFFLVFRLFFLIVSMLCLPLFIELPCCCISAELIFIEMCVCMWLCLCVGVCTFEILFNWIFVFCVIFCKRPCQPVVGYLLALTNSQSVGCTF